MTKEPPPKLTDWTGKEWTPGCGRPAAHPNARFTVALTRVPSLDPHWDDPEGVPVDAFIFGGRRSTTIPLVTEARSWSDGVYMAATLGSETTAAITGQVGVVRRDPFAMIAFCGYNMSEYFAHWLAFGEKLAGAPRIYLVNWFRKDASGKFIWPGYGENMRVLKWIVERVEGRADAKETPLGRVPAALDMAGLESFDPERFKAATSVDPSQWSAEMKLHGEMLGKRLEGRAPAQIQKRYEELNKQFV
jgi:phosphoenolpyruvate carboxykinase (GTP)